MNHIIDPDNRQNYFLLVVVVVGVIGGILISALVAKPPTPPITGVVVKMWVENNRDIMNDYVTLQLSDGSKKVIAVWPAAYGIPEVGQTCTFSYTNSAYATSATCESGAR